MCGYRTAEMCVLVRWMSIFASFSGWNELLTSGPKTKRSIQTVISNKSRNLSVMAWDCISVLGKKSHLYFYDSCISADKYAEIIKLHMLPSRNLSWGRPYIFQEDNAKPHVHTLQRYDEETGTSLVCLQLWPVPYRERMENTFWTP